MFHGKYRLGSTVHVRQQLRQFAKRALDLGIEAPVANALSDISQRLQTDPLGFGEPINNTKKPGGLIHTAVRRPYFSLTFAVYVQEQFVLLFDVQPLPRSPLE